MWKRETDILREGGQALYYGKGEMNILDVYEWASASDNNLKVQAKFAGKACWKFKNLLPSPFLDVDNRKCIFLLNMPLSPQVVASKVRQSACFSDR